MEYVTVQGEDVPAVGFGTWELTGRRCRHAVEMALETGYRHVDTAAAYGNERQVGQALANADMDREEVFLTTKVKGTDARRDDLVASARASVDRLGVEFVDLLLIHWPNPLVSVRETVEALNEVKEMGLTRHVGVSNYGVGRLRRAQAVSDTPIFTNQVLRHPFYPQRALRDHCQHHDMLLTAYSPLAHGGLMGDRVLREIGRKYDKTPAQVAIRWTIEDDNVATIPKATSRQHIQENFDVFDFELTETERRFIERPSLLRTGVMWFTSQFA
ncbi:aldo/keto reductase [Halobacteriaceae archaeon GCM10025711]